MLLRFVAGRPVSGVTRAFLAWVAGRLAAEGVRVLLLIWDNAPGTSAARCAPGSRPTTAGSSATAAAGFWSAACRAGAVANPIEPEWMHGKRAVVEADRKLTAEELQQRLCDHYRCPLAEPLAQQAA